MSRGTGLEKSLLPHKYVFTPNKSLSILLITSSQLLRSSNKICALNWILISLWSLLFLWFRFFHTPSIIHHIFPLCTQTVASSGGLVLKTLSWQLKPLSLKALWIFLLVSSDARTRLFADLLLLSSCLMRWLPQTDEAWARSFITKEMQILCGCITRHEAWAGRRRRWIADSFVVNVYGLFCWSWCGGLVDRQLWLLGDPLSQGWEIGCAWSTRFCWLWEGDAERTVCSAEEQKTFTPEGCRDAMESVDWNWLEAGCAGLGTSYWALMNAGSWQAQANEQFLMHDIGVVQGCAGIGWQFDSITVEGDVAN